MRISAAVAAGVVMVGGVIPAAAAKPPRPSIGDAVYADVNGNGEKDRGEPGVKGVELTLMDAEGAELATATTKSRGGYLFDSVAAGSYTVVVGELPDGYQPLRKKNREIAVEVAEDPVDDLDIALTPLPSSISGKVVTSGRGVATVTVTLSGADMTGEAVEASATTEQDGTYTFADLRAGTYELVVEGAEPVAVELAPGMSVEQPDLARALLRRSSIAGFVWHDQNADGSKQNNEPGIPGVKMVLRGTDGEGNDVRANVTTDSSGAFLFDELAQGTYNLTQTQPDAYIDGAEIIGSAGGTADGGNKITDIALGTRVDASGYGFGETGNVVAGTVWLDRNEDGDLDDGEPGRLGGIKLTLENNSGDTVATTRTADDGTYAFVSVPVGRYDVIEEQPDGYGTTTPNRVGLRVEEGGATVDFGEDPGVITGVAWDDDARPDGFQANDELGLGGVTFQLLDRRGNVLAETVTTSDGRYAFDDLAAARYTVVVRPPVGDTLSANDLGSDPTVDSDFVPATASVTIDVGNGDDFDDVDAGLFGARPDLAVAITANDTTPDIGQDLVLTATVANVGPVAVRGGIIATLTLPSTISYLSESSDAWTCTPQTGRVTCTYGIDLGVGQSTAPLIITVDYTSATVGDAIIAVAPQNGAIDAVATNNSAALRFTTSGVGPTPTPGGGGLPVTGSNTGGLVWMGAALILLGGTITGIGRFSQRRQTAAVTAPVDASLPDGSMRF